MIGTGQVNNQTNKQTNGQTNKVATWKNKVLCKLQLYEFPDQGRVVSCRMQAKAGSNSLILANFQVKLLHFSAGKLSCMSCNNLTSS